MQTISHVTRPLAANPPRELPGSRRQRVSHAQRKSEASGSPQSEPNKRKQTKALILSIHPHLPYKFVLQDHLKNAMKLKRIWYDMLWLAKIGKGGRSVRTNDCLWMGCPRICRPLLPIIAIAWGNSQKNSEFKSIVERFLNILDIDSLPRKAGRGSSVFDSAFLKKQCSKSFLSNISMQLSITNFHSH